MAALRVWMGGWLAGACAGCSAILGIGDPTIQAADDGGPVAAPPASGQLGAACTIADDCASTECLLNANDPNQSGLCTSSCTSSADCGPQGTCIPQAALQQSVCFLTCSTTADCAQGAVCTSNSSSASGVCASGGTADLTPFLGSWQLVNGTESLSACSDGTSDTTAPESTSLRLEVTRGTTSDLVATYVGGSGCSFNANVAGSVAVAPIPQTCDVVQAGYSLTLTAGTFGVSGNAGQVAATATYKTTSGQPVTCMDAIQETFMKL